MIQLRGYQEDMVQGAREALLEHRRVFLQAPTGAGKTALAVHMMGNAARRGRSSFFLVHQNELLKQTSAALWQQRLQHGVIAPNRRPSKLPVQVASVQTLVRRLDRYQAPDLIIIDEAHRSVSPTYQKILAAYPDAYVIGLSATPERTDKKPLSEIYSHLVKGPEPRWLIEHGWLCDYKIIAPATISQAELSGVKMSGNDYAAAALEELVNKSKITGNAIAEYRRHAFGKRCVTMCVSIKHARDVAAEYNRAGIPAASIEGEMTGVERDDVLQRFRSGEIRVITNVNLLIEGVDIPQIEVVQWLRSTQSLIVWMQGIGRGLRPHKDKPHLIILDHMRNWSEHGLPDEIREWSLDAPVKRKRGKRDEIDEQIDTRIAQCTECYAVFERGPDKCPSCGADVAVLSRIPEEVAGELVEIEKKEAAKQRRIQQGMARSIPDLVAVAHARGLARPAEWAVIIYSKRARRATTKADFREANDALAAIKLGRGSGEAGII